MTQNAEKLRELGDLEREVHRLRVELFQGITTPKLEWSGSIDLLLVGCADERLAIRLELITEVVRMAKLRPAPFGIDDLLGWLDFRGTAVPVLDLRARMGWGTTPLALSSMIVVLSAAGRDLGVVIDEVIDVVRVDGSRLKAPDGQTTTRPGVEALLLDESAIVPIVQPYLWLTKDDVAALETEVAPSDDASSGDAEGERS